VTEQPAAPAPAASSPAPSATPAPTPAPAPLHTPAPRQRQPAPENPRARRADHWSDASSGEGRWLAAERARRAAAGQAEPPAGSTPPEGTPPSGQQQQRAGDETRHKIGDLELTEAEVRGLMERHALEESRKLTQPTDPSQYKLDLPKNFTVPQGMEWNWDLSSMANKSAVEAAQSFAHKAGLSQEQFSELMGIYAGLELDRTQRYATAARAEVEKLGQAGSQRVTAIQQFIRSQIGDDLAPALLGVMSSAKAVEGFEKLMANFASQGGGSYSAANQTPPASNGKIVGYETMTFEQRRAAQDAIAARGKR
jgi:hypothetical protein